MAGEEREVSDDSGNAKHWSRWVFRVSPWWYCRYWGARLAWRAAWAGKQMDELPPWFPVWLVFVFELVRIRQTIQVRHHRGTHTAS